MASRRRLDISSLLCDSNEESSASRTESRLSRASAQYEPQAQAQQVPTQVPSFDEQTAFVYSKASSPHNSQQYERISQGQHGVHQRRQDGPVYWDGRSPGPLPSPVDLVPLALHPPSPHRHSPTSSFSPPSRSPVESAGPLRISRHSDGSQESTFPRPSSSSTRQPRSHPHRYTQFPQPPSSTPPVNIRQPSDPARGQQAFAQISLHQYSPISLPHPSPSPSSASSLPNNFSASARHLSISPTDLAHPRRPSTSSSSEKPFQQSPVLPRQSETAMNTSRRTSASVSPSVPFPGLSGLDVLVQAATEERERIDVHRRLSGGDDPQVSPNYTSYARHASLSPVVPKGEIFQAPPPTPPYSATSQTAAYLPLERTDVYYGRQIVEETIRRRLSSPEPSYSRQVDDSRLFQNIPGPSTIVVDNQRHRSQVSEMISNEYEHQSRLQDTSTSRQYPGSRPGSLYAPSSSARNVVQRASLDEPETSSSSHISHALSSVDPGTTSYIRQSPPRSRPKPKKPGSAALANMEKELAESHVKESGNRQVRRSSPPRPQVHRSLPGIKPATQQSNERGASEDEEVDDFFLSAFDSPRQGERQVPTQKSRQSDVPSVRTEEAGVSSERWHHTHSSHSAMQHQAYSPWTQRPSPERANEYSDYSSPARGTFDHDDEETMPDVEAEIFDELAEAAGGMTSEAERTDFDDQATDNMEVDVENELLSLVDGPPEPSSKSYHHVKPPSMHSSNQSDLQDFDLDRVSMPPPDALKGTSTKPKDSKKKSLKPKLKPAKAPPFEVAKPPTKASSIRIQDAPAKPSKPKTGAKPRHAKGQPADKGQGVKTLKEPSTPISTSLPVLSEPAASSSTPTNEAFPIVTSSGRMVTKSKKSAAASSSLSHNQTSSSHRKKVPTAPPAPGDGGSSRSRSHSVLPRASVDPEARREKTAREDEDKPKEKEKEKDAHAPEADDPDKNKLYCLCRTQYDEDRVMIACDRCDEWYHTQCVNMSDLLVDLVDQFICANCIAQSPGLNLRTTYKQRCYSGLKHPNPDSPEACHKPSRGAYSKYCSDECGVRHMHRKIQSWAGNGGDVGSLWESVKDAKRREGFVTREPGRTLPKAIFAEIQNGALPRRTQTSAFDVKQTVEDEKERNVIVSRLEEQLQTVVQEREELKKQLEVLSWRERLLQLASARAENVGECGWDQRLVYGDEEWLEFGRGVLESYDDAVPNGHVQSEERQEMDVDGEAAVGEWWCRGKKKCERHVGWQRVRAADLELERTTKEESLAELTTQEREIRNRIEDILHPQSRSAGAYTEPTLKFKVSSSEGGGKKNKKKPVTATTVT